MDDNNDNRKIIPFPGKGGGEPSQGIAKTVLIGILSAVLSSLITALILAILSGVFTLPKDLERVQDDVKKLEERTIPDIKADIKDDLSEIKGSISKNEQMFNKGIEIISERIDNMFTISVNKLGLVASDEYSKQIASGLGRKSSFDLDSGPVVTAVVARNQMGIEYTAEELVDLNLLLPYTDGDQKGFFYGQINEHNRWDGNCIVNVYKRKKLILITDAMYDDGKLLSCKQVFPDVTTGRMLDGETVDKINIWVVSDREIENGVSSGQTWHFFREGDFSEVIQPDVVTASEMISADKFMETLDAELEGYYSGDVSNGRFNDSSGNAYMVKFFDNGSVKTLYAGNFKNGQFDDSTGNAWMIGKKKISQEKYAYYTGEFKNGYYAESGGKWIYNLEMEQIQNIIEKSGIAFDQDLLIWEPPAI